MAEKENDKDDDKKRTPDEKRIREPFPPENTPQPPQVMDASKEPESEKETKDSARKE